MNTRATKKEKTSDLSPFVPFKKHRKNSINNSPVEGDKEPPTTKQISFDLLCKCFTTLNAGIWWRIIPLGDGYDDISVGTGIEWDDLLPLLMDAGFLKVTERRTKAQYGFCRNRWLHDLAIPGPDLRIGSYRQRNDTHGKQWFICNGKAIFNSPKQQVDTVGKARFAYLQLKYAG